jgi:ABC-type multidrug transport system fused ATPase/permease subunit
MNLHSPGCRDTWPHTVVSDGQGLPPHHDPTGDQVLEGEAVASLKSVTCGYRRQPVFHDVTLMLRAGQLTGLVGPTGSGKTTLLKALLGVGDTSNAGLYRLRPAVRDA